MSFRASIDRMDREQAAKITEVGIEVGDFINLDTWFGDIWAEVLSEKSAENRRLMACDPDPIGYVQSVSRTQMDNPIGTGRVVGKTA